MNVSRIISKEEKCSLTRLCQLKVVKSQQVFVQSKSFLLSHNKVGAYIHVIANISTTISNSKLLEITRIITYRRIIISSDDLSLIQHSKNGMGKPIWFTLDLTFIRVQKTGRGREG